MKRLVESERVLDGQITRVQVEGVDYLLTRQGDSYYACENRCPHLGFPMARGKVSECTIRCPWHGSSFDLRTGENLDWTNAFAGIPMPRWTHRAIALGRKPQALRVFSARVEDGWVVIDDR